jgi:hypothetical protein
MTVVNVGEKLFVGLLVAGGFREVEDHDRDKGVDVRYCHGLHVAELRNRGVDGGNVVGSRSRRVILETEARPEATGKDLVRDRGTCDLFHETSCAAYEGFRAMSLQSKYRPVVPG